MRGHRRGFADSDRFLDRLQRELDRKGAEDRAEDAYKALDTYRRKVGVTADEARAILASVAAKP